MHNGAELAGRRVLIVEDEFLLGMELEARLKQHGCEVLGPAPTVEWALALIYEDKPDLALLDVNLKGVRATQVAAAPRERGVAFVLIAAYSDVQLGEPELRAAPRVAKPVNGRDLRRAVAQALQAAAASARPERAHLPSHRVPQEVRTTPRCLERGRWGRCNASSSRHRLWRPPCPPY